jgi:hypothetical protein
LAAERLMPDISDNQSADEAALMVTVQMADDSCHWVKQIRGMRFANLYDKYGLHSV